MIKKLIYIGIGLAVCGLIYLAVAHWAEFKLAVMAIVGVLLGYGATKTLKAKKKAHESNIKKRKIKTDGTLKKIGKRVSLKSRVANRNKRSKKR